LADEVLIFSSKSEAEADASSSSSSSAFWSNEDSEPEDEDDEGGDGRFLGVEEDAVLTRVDFRIGEGAKYGLLVVDFLGGILRFAEGDWLSLYEIWLFLMELKIWRGA